MSKYSEELLDSVINEGPKRWYILTYSAEQDGYALVHLTASEANVVRRTLSEPIVYGGGYCGSTKLSEDSWESQYSAKIALMEGEFT